MANTTNSKQKRERSRKKQDSGAQESSKKQHALNLDALAVEVENISFSYGDNLVFEDVSFSLARGEVLTILGANGAGKSTLLNCLGGILKPAKGQVRLFGDPIEELQQETIATRLGYVPQLQNTSVDYSVRDYLVLGRAPYISMFSSPGKEDYERVEQVIHTMQIERLADKSLQELSGGERQQVHIARALVQEPYILLFDEPTNHLDYGNQLKVLETIVELLDRDCITVILTTHTPDYAILLGGKTALLDHMGHLRVGPTEEIVTEKNLRSIYDTDLSMIYVEELGRLVCAPGNLRKKRAAESGSTSETEQPQAALQDMA